MQDATENETLRHELEGQSVARLMKIATAAWWKFALTGRRAMAITLLGEKGKGQVAVSSFLYHLFCQDPSPDIQSAAANAMGQPGFVPILEGAEREKLSHVVMTRLSASIDISYTCSLLRLLGNCDRVIGPQLGAVEGAIRTKQEQIGGEWQHAPVVVWMSYALVQRGYKTTECLDMLRSVVHIARQPIMSLPNLGPAFPAMAQAAAVSTRLIAAREALLDAVTALGPKAQPLKADLLPLTRDPAFADEPWRSRLHNALLSIGATTEEVASQPPHDPDAAFLKEFERIKAVMESSQKHTRPGPSDTTRR